MPTETLKTIPVMLQLPADFADSGEAKPLIDELRQLVGDFRREFDELKKAATPLTFTEQQLADYFGISLLTMQRIRRSGKISYTRVGGRIHYTRMQVEDYLNQAQTGRAARRSGK